MAYYDTTWYCNAGDQSTTGYYAVAKRPQNTAVVAGQLCRQFTAPTVNNERVFICIVAGTTANTTDATWVLTRGAKTVDGTATWMECTGLAGLNGDVVNTANWTTAKATGTPTLGAIIKRNSGASYQICTTAGTLGASEPSFSDTAGVTTTEGTTTWTSLGVVGNFTGGQAPHARMTNVFSSGWFAAGHTLYVGDNHAESQASSLTIGPIGAGGANLIGKILCHNHSGSYPPTALMTGATVTATGANSISFGWAGTTNYVYGIMFNAGVGTSGFSGGISLNSTNSVCLFDNCSFRSASTGSGGSNITVGSTVACLFVWNNCTLSFGNAGQLLEVAVAQLIWQNTGPVLVSGSAVPTTFFQTTSNGKLSTVVVEGVDLSQLTGSLVGSGFFQMGSVLFKDCKLNAAATAVPFGYGQTVQLVRCDSGGTAYKSTRYQSEGTETTETSITRVGGAADPAGQAQSRKIVTTAISQWLRPFKAEPYAIWNAVTGANVTVTVYGTINSGTLPSNDDIWLELTYEGSSASPLGTIKTTTKANLFASNAVVSSDGSTWNGGGSGAGWSPFKLTTTLSSPQPGMAGYIHVRVRAAKASTTYYIDPQIVLS